MISARIRSSLVPSIKNWAENLWNISENTRRIMSQLLCFIGSQKLDHELRLAATSNPCNDQHPRSGSILGDPWSQNSFFNKVPWLLAHNKRLCEWGKLRRHSNSATGVFS